MSGLFHAMPIPTIALGRRAFLQVGALALGKMTLAGALQRRALAGAQAGESTAVIQIYMGGGPSHLDMYDLKPLAPREIRGEFQPISTSLPGVQICEHLPYLAGVMDKVAVVRTVHHQNAGHLPASHWMMTGHQPASGSTGNANPAVGAVVSRLRGSNHSGVPAYVSIPRRQLLGASAFLGPAHNPFTPESDPSKNDFAVFNLKMPSELSVPRLEDRRGLLQSLDRLRSNMDIRNEFDGIDKFSQQAADLVTSGRALKAFDLKQEDPRVRESYGPHSVGQGCLLARRLVEAGVTFVTVLSGGDWDTHVGNFPKMKDDCLPRVDRAIAALVSDLHARGLNRRVMVVAYGEFGRTPHINKDGGRDHWPGASCALFAGGGLKVGQIIGQTDAHAAFPITRGYSPGDVLSTVYQFLQVDSHHEFREQNQQRPMQVLPEGQPIAELIG
ncbi:DUF1501 domain-containing protein [Schlesneria paludicola]|uniref:DUF1501 domain-containing protein n=1 Tax=Schlesneria paludicola TaxID=360056 RepID=UPI00029A4467|nr:DUF1501 domain-containing protein [Schlesneria paludicola]